MEDPTPRLGDRTLFPDLEWAIYGNHASVSPPSAPVRRAVDDLVGAYAARGLDGFFAWHDRQVALRARLARLIGAASEDLAFVPNTTTGVVDIALCLPWRASDHVIVFEGEFPTNVTPWQGAAETFDLRITALPLDGFGDHTGRGLERLEDALRGGARLVAVSAVEFQTGLAMPLKAMADLAHAHGAELFVDAIQAVGIRPLDVKALGVDYLASGAHKWLMGMTGGGLLYVAPERIEALVPRVAGWLSHEDPMVFLSEPDALRYDRPIRARTDFVENGVGDTVALAALAASTEILETLGVAAIYDHVQRYHDRLERVLLNRGFASLRAPDPTARSGILSVKPPPGRTHAEIAQGLAERGISVARPDGLVRFSPHWPNALHEVPRIAEALDEVLAATGC